MTRLFLALFTLALATGCASQQEKDASTLQGTWQAVSVDQTHWAFPPDGLKALLTTQYTFAGNQVTLNINGQDVQAFAYTLDTTPTPRRITLTNPADPQKPIEGIYQINGDQLTLAGGGSDTTIMEFKSDKSTGTLSITFKKAPAK